MELDDFMQGQIRRGTVCPYCLRRTQLVKTVATSSGHKVEYMRQCKPCDAKVLCHPGTKNAMGKVANQKLRTLRRVAHKYFDKLWKYKMTVEYTNKAEARNAAYQWLADQLGIPFDDCHIGYFGYNRIGKVIDICKFYCEELGL